MKKEALSIKELDVQPLSDEELQAFSEVDGGTSEVIYCTCNSDVIYCTYSIFDSK